MDRSETDEESLIGDECHIVAKEPTRSRGESPLTPEQRDEYENLILMCKNHHKLIDDQPQTYSIQKLKEMKAHHEKWVRETLTGFDPAKQRDEEQYSECVERWVEDVELDNWIDWSSRWIFMSPRPAISYEKLDAFENLRLWLDSRVWPKRYPELEYAFENFRRVLYDLESVHYRHSTQGEVRRDYSVTDKYYHFAYDSNGRELKTKQEKCKEYELHHELLGDLMLELTRAANYICDKVRIFVDPTFRIREGVVLVAFGTGDFRRTEYQTNERVSFPYPGLEQFIKIRKNRDVTF